MWTVWFVFALGITHVLCLQCYKGQIYANGTRDVLSTTCAGNQYECLTCLVPRTASLNKCGQDFHSYGCANDAFKNFVEALGSENCVTCSQDMCNGIVGTRALLGVPL